MIGHTREKKSPLVAVVSWNQVGRTDLTPVKLPESVLLTLSRRKLWYRGNHPCRDENNYILDVPRHGDLDS